MDASTRLKISHAVRKANWRKRLSVAMKESWARRREEFVPIPDEVPVASLVDLQQAALLLGVNEDELRSEILNGVSTAQLVSSLEDFKGGGTNFQKRLRQVLNEKIREAVSNHA